MAVPQLVRYFDLGGAVDVDPLTQPAADYLGKLTSGFGTRVLIHAWVVDALAQIVAPGLLTTDVVVAWVHQVEVDTDPAGNAKRTVKAWGRGPIAATKTPGLGLTQAELADVVGFTVAITAVSAPLAGHRLAIFATKGPR